MWTLIFTCDNIKEQAWYKHGWFLTWSFIDVTGRILDNHTIIDMVCTTNIVSSNPAHGKVYTKQHYVIKFVSDLWQICGFLRFPLPIKLTTTYNWNTVECGVKHHNPNPQNGLLITFHISGFAFNVILPWENHSHNTNQQ